MTTTVISPNMNLPVPVVGVEIGPNWANDLNACMSAIDSHDHASGQGVQITPDGLNINADLPAGSNNITTVRSIRFAAQSAPLAVATDLGCIYESGVDLYYNDGSGNQIRITQGGSVTGATGTITGLPSGTASASFAGGTFTWRSATNTPATMSTGPLVIGAQIVSPHTVTIGASAALAADYAMTLPLALPAVAAAVVSDNAGSLSFVGLSSASFSPTMTFTHSSGATIGISVNTSTWYYTRVGNVVSAIGKVLYTTSGYTSTATYSVSATIPVATASLASAGTYNATQSGGGPTGYYLVDISNTSVGTFSTIVYGGNTTFSITFSYSYIVS